MSLDELSTTQTVPSLHSRGPPLTLAVAGGSGAGKTTLSRALYRALGEGNVTYLVHDDYYKDLSHLPLKDRAKTNFDHPDSLDTELLVQHIKALKEGKSVDVPTYDFATHSRTTTTMRKEPKKIIILEGILLFTHPELVTEMSMKVYVDADSDVRLSRRISRDIAERGRTEKEVIDQYHSTVQPMHDEHVEPSKRQADLIVHSSRHSMDVAVRVLTNHFRVEAGIDE